VARNEDGTPASRWLELKATVDRESVDDVAAIMGHFGKSGAVIEEIPSPQGTQRDGDLTVKVYLPEDSTLPREKARLLEALGHLSMICPIPIQEQTLSQEDWLKAWKALFAARRVGKRLVIKPPELDYRAREGDVIVEINPGMAFGTGLHPTTQLCLQELERKLNPGAEVLDLGTGSGIQAIAAARLGAGRVLALDTDPEAVRAAQANILANGLDAVVAVGPGTLPHPSATGPFDLVVANITAGVIGEKAESLVGALKPGGTLIAGGILADRVVEVGARLGGAGGRVIRRRSRGGWRTLVVAPTIHLREAIT